MCQQVFTSLCVLATKYHRFVQPGLRPGYAKRIVNAGTGSAITLAAVWRCILADLCDFRIIGTVLVLTPTGPYFLFLPATRPIFRCYLRDVRTRIEAPVLQIWMLE